MQTGVTVGNGVFVATTLGGDVIVGGGSGVEVGGGAGGFPQDERITAAIRRMKICFFMSARLYQSLIQTSIARQNRRGNLITQTRFYGFVPVNMRTKKSDLTMICRFSSWA